MNRHLLSTAYLPPVEYFAFLLADDTTVEREERYQKHTNDHYAKMQADFQVIDSSGEVILTISPNGQSINNIDQDEYLNDDDELNKLLRLYKQICDSDAVIIPALE